MKKIETIKFKNLRGEAHMQYLLLFKRHVVEMGVAALLPVELWENFNKLFAIETTLVDKTRSSDLTGELAIADARENRNLVGIRHVISAGLYHYDPIVVEAARILDGRYKSFGRIANKPYEEEVAAISILLNDFNGIYATEVVILNLQGWVNDLAEANAEFQRLFVLRNAQITGRPKGSLRETRNKIDDVYRQLRDFIESKITVNPTPELDAFVKTLNTHTAYFNQRAHHRTKLDLANATLDMIPVQHLNGGRAATPLPVVRYDGVPLSFLTDYKVSYKNNRKPGTATVVITGNGAYRGQRKIAFNIVGD